MSRVVDRDDDAGLIALAGLRSRILNLAANALAQSADHLDHFFSRLRQELAFYRGCLNLHDLLTARGLPVCVAVPCASHAPDLRARGLYDPCLALRSDLPVVTNDLDADDASWIVITGANQGGKSTFLRALGLAHLMARAGMPVAAASFRAALPTGIFSHFARAEDEERRGGKLDEELRRLRAIAEAVQPGGLVLLNESLSSTNEREGSAIAAEVLLAFAGAGVRSVVVTHFRELVDRLRAATGARAVFLQAERSESGERTFRLVPGEPTTASWAVDLIEQTFRPERTDPS